MPARSSSPRLRALTGTAVLFAALGVAARAQTTQTLPAGLAQIAGNDRTIYPGAGGDGSAGFVLEGIDDYDASGISVSAAGDVNGDGLDEFLIGARSADPGGQSSAGESYVVFGRSAIMDTDDDGVPDNADNCVQVANSDQRDTNVDGIGNICDANPGAGFTLGEINASCVCVAVSCTQNLTIEIQTDANPNQITWELREQGTNQLIQSGTPTPPNGIQTMNTCVPDGCYFLKVTH